MIGSGWMLPTTTQQTELEWWTPFAGDVEIWAWVQADLFDVRRERLGVFAERPRRFRQAPSSARRNAFAAAAALLSRLDLAPFDTAYIRFPPRRDGRVAEGA